MKDNQESYNNQENNLKEPIGMSEYVRELNHKSLIEVVSSNIIKRILSDIDRDTLIKVVDNYTKNNYDKEKILQIIYCKIKENKIKEKYNVTKSKDNDYWRNLWNIKVKEEEKDELEMKDIDLKSYLKSQLEEYIGLTDNYESFLTEYSNSYELTSWQDTLGSLITGLNEESEEMGREMTDLLLLLFKIDKTIQVFDGTIKGFFRGDHKDIFHLFKGKLATIEKREIKQPIIERITESNQLKFNKTREKMVTEMGDIYAYFTLIRLFFNISMEEIIESNQNKLQERWQKNQQLRGSRE